MDALVGQRMLRHKSGIRVFFLMFFILVVVSAVGQQSAEYNRDLPYTKDPVNLPKALTNVEKGQYSGLDVELIVQMKATQAIPALEEEFAKEQNAEAKSKIAYGLVKLKVSDDVYWNYLASRASEAINRRVPDPFRYDVHGKMLLDQPSEAFVRWAAGKGLEPRTAYEQVEATDLGAIFDLASSDDQRAIPLLRKVLLLPNCVMQISAASGLADLSDEGAIPLIVKASADGKAKEGCAEGIARSLVYFDDPRTQHAVDLYLPPETARIAREERAKGRGPM